MHKACHQLCLDCKSVNTKRLSPYPPGKGVAKSFPQLGLAVSLLGRHCNTATRSESVAGLQNDYCRQSEERPVGFRLHLSVGWVTAEQSGLLTRIAVKESVSLCVRMKR